MDRDDTQPQAAGRLPLEVDHTERLAAVAAAAAAHLPLEVNKAVRDSQLNQPLGGAEVAGAKRLAAIAAALAPLKTESSHLTAAALLLLLADGQMLGERIADALECLADYHHEDAPPNSALHRVADRVDLIAERLEQIATRIAGLEVG